MRLTIILIHDTWAAAPQNKSNSADRWSDPRSDFSRGIVSGVAEHSKCKFIEFKWDGLNSVVSRRKAAEKLRDVTERYLRRRQDSVLMIGHSHGGTIALNAAAFLNADDIARVSVITMSTPIFRVVHNSIKTEMDWFKLNLLLSCTLTFWGFWLGVYYPLFLLTPSYFSSITKSPLEWITATAAFCSISLTIFAIYNLNIIKNEFHISESLIKSLDFRKIRSARFKHLALQSHSDEVAFGIRVAVAGSVLAEGLMKSIYKLIMIFLYLHIGQMYFGLGGGRVCDLPLSILVPRTRECTSFSEPVIFHLGALTLLLSIIGNLMKGAVGREFLLGSLGVSIQRFDINSRKETLVRTIEFGVNGRINHSALEHSLHKSPMAVSECAAFINNILSTPENTDRLARTY